MPTISFTVTKAEKEQIELAARLSGRTVREWLVRVINFQLQSMGVDAVLLHERED